MEPKFKTGDIVRLVSGGPDMTIRGFHFDVWTNRYKDDMFDCVWFDNNKDGKRQVYYGPFHTDELVKITETTNA